MTGQMMEITGYAVGGISVLLLILSEVIFRRKKKKIISAVEGQFADGGHYE